MRTVFWTLKPNMHSTEPLRCVADGATGTASALELCTSACQFTPSPLGNAAPSQGWCWTANPAQLSADGRKWGACCCQPNCALLKPVTAYPAKYVACNAMDPRTSIVVSGQKCLTAGGTLPAFAPCTGSVFQRWIVGYDGYIQNVGSTWCLQAQGVNRTALFAPCALQDATQTWALVANQKLSLYADPTACLSRDPGGSDVLTVRTCAPSNALQVLAYKVAPQCGSLKGALCATGPARFGCACTMAPKNKACVN
jgi:hypothetical protein